ncbi:MAG: hypothetical protein ACKVP7_00660 [Hyphomicrobiaceae bacterium]
MFDLSKLADAAWGLFGSAPGVSDAPTAALEHAIANAGIDINALQDLSPDQIFEMLAANGIDLSSFAPDQVSGLFGSLGIDQQFSDGVGTLLSNLPFGDHRR